ncbi:MAG TPA: S53 family peptidase [Ideonella sp.]|uniref:S53 family peptidase n=1 Tax=Ideonella sp. TaxID=1929293 RepID=UPI002BE6FF78|nr:S53 family peptidase [Ideonella sp.]HSI47047.1 S53 family peptidase [Ideonella sp.]
MTAAVLQLLSVGASAQDLGTAARKLVHTREACSRDVAEGHARCHAHIVLDRNGEDLVTAAPSGLSPASLRSAYKITGNGSAATVIAVVDAYHYANAEADLAVYRTQFGLPACTKANGCFKQIDQNGGTNYPGTNKGWNQEAALDLDMVSAMCPSCSIVFVEASSTSSANLAKAVNTAAALPGVRAISNSYGGGESGSTSYESAYDHLNIAVVVSSGDSGYGVQFPASSPHVIAVGGTSLKTASNSRGWVETAWSGAGSGCSTVYAKPSWQLDTGCAKRTVADVSAVADPNTGVAVYAPKKFGTKSGWQVYGGTSVAAPVIAGIYGVNGGPVTYGSDPYSHTNSIFDVTSGSNGSCGGSYLCTSGTGYDGPTGLGTPNGTAGL